jgi:hypothetical protein
VLLLLYVVLSSAFRLRLSGGLCLALGGTAGWIQNPPVNEPPPEPILLADAAEISSPPDPAPPSHLPPPASPSSSSASPLEEDSPFLEKRKRSWAKLIARAWLEDPSLCRSCGLPMKIIAAFTSPQQDDVIERILRHMNLWDPPWKRHRKVRGTPPSSMDGSASSPAETRKCEETFEAEAIDPIIDDELYVVDPVPPDDDAPT